MSRLAYRIGKRVGVFYFDMKKNRTRLRVGRIVARRWWYSIPFKDRGEALRAKYAVRFSDGEVQTYDHEQLWTKFIKEENE